MCEASDFEDSDTLTHIQTLNPDCFKGGKHWLLHGVTQSLSWLSLRLNAKRQQNRKRTLCGFDLCNGLSSIISHLEHWQIPTHYFGLLIQMSLTYTWPWCDCDRFSKLRSVINLCHYQWYTRHLIKVCNGGIIFFLMLQAVCTMLKFMAFVWRWPWRWKLEQ